MWWIPPIVSKHENSALSYLPSIDEIRNAIFLWIIQMLWDLTIFKVLSISHVRILLDWILMLLYKIPLSVDDYIWMLIETLWYLSLKSKGPPLSFSIDSLHLLSFCQGLFQRLLLIGSGLLSNVLSLPNRHRFWKKKDIFLIAWFGFRTVQFYGQKIFEW